MLIEIQCQALVCFIRDQHVPECSIECHGCLPGIAVRGAYCEHHYQRLVRALKVASRYQSWLLSMGYVEARGSGMSYDGDNRGSGRSGHANLTGAGLAHDELVNELLGWVRCLEEEHPAVGFMSRGQDPAEWLLKRVDSIAIMPWLDDAAESIWITLRPFMKRWPLPEEPAPEVNTGVTCWACDKASVWRKPPVFAGGAELVKCGGCGEMYDEYRWLRLCEQRALEAKRVKC